jgi:predicted MFS family arabinose efflux permease
MAIVGLLAVVVQILVALTATLALPAQRGRAVGTVTSGVVIGILLARLFSGLLADFAGWRAVYLASAGLMFGMTALLSRVLPRHVATRAPRSYVGLLRSTAALFVEERVLRIRAVFAFLIFAAFSTFWTSIALPLSGPPFSLSHTAIGLLGLAGVAGATAAASAGRLADRGWAQSVTGLSLTLLALAWLPMAWLDRSIWMVVIGVIVLDFAVQAVHVTNQSLIFAARPEAHSRLVAGYMVFYSAGSACGATASTIAYAKAGWTGVCLLGFAISVGALLFWSASQRRAVPAASSKRA